MNIHSEFIILEKSQFPHIHFNGGFPMKAGGTFLIQPVASSPIFTTETFSDEQKEISTLTLEFAEEQILPRKKQIEALDGELSRNLMKQCGELGLLGVDIPEEYGGLGMDKVTSAIIAEKISMGQSGSFTTTFSAHTGIGTLPIVLYGTPEQKEKYLPKLGSGEWIGAYALTEPGSGSDALAAKTTAVLSEDGKYYVLNGVKQFITNGSWCDLVILYAKVDGEKFTAFLIEMDTPGMERGPEEVKMGLKGSSTTQLILNDVKVPVENVLGEVGKGHHIAFNILNIGRYKLGSADLGGCKVTINEAVKYALERRQFDQPIAHFDAIKAKLANMIVRTFELESIMYRTVGDIDQSISRIRADDPNYYNKINKAIETYALEASICKVYGSEMLWRNADDGLQILGGYGFTEEYPMAAISRDNRVDRIFEGTNEINRQIIAGQFLKKALTEELPIRQRINQMRAVMSGRPFRVYSDILPQEKTALEYAKFIALHAFNESIIKYGQGMRHEHQLLELLANMFINIYVMDSTLARISQAAESNGALPEDLKTIGQLSVFEKVRHVTREAKIALLSILEGEELQTALDELNALTRHTDMHLNAFEARRYLAEVLYEKGKYEY
ncbi:MAG TPA: acyl-CoA dehydrogenase [Caldithrix abyssi]|uniref:Acyl-CoA dehydrogenase n=1 Tax=Caldithrix abyssi TaxID=187145 RepID=A0A7V4WVT2_CALAY|nr:acyl-CoA dehydrogenase [Caldithrix abyssi]